MIEVTELRKEYGDVVAVAGIDFTVEAGTIFGLLGPNGAGKSTTIGCISGLVKPSGGRVRVNGHDVIGEGRKAKAKLGVVPQELALYEDISATDNLSYLGSGVRAPWGRAEGAGQRGAGDHRPARPRA